MGNLERSYDLDAVVSAHRAACVGGHSWVRLGDAEYDAIAGTVLLRQHRGAVEAIRKAPHAGHCEARSPMWPGPCTCWKREWIDS